MKEVHIGSYKVGENHPPFIVAEISANHNGSLERVLEIVEAAKKAGAHAVKLQTYTADTMTLNLKSGDFLIHDKSSLWFNHTLYDIYSKGAMPWQWHKPIFERCRELGLLAFSTPFDDSAVDFLETLNVPCYKIASLEITDLPLIKKAAKTKKPLILSTGASSLDEIKEAVSAARDAGCIDLILLQCTSTYPADPKDVNLKTIPDLSERFQVVVGLSDHTLTLGVPIAAVALGASVIEKHLTLSRKEGGLDDPFSMEPDEFQALVRECKCAWEAKGKPFYGIAASEKTSHSHRRSIYFVKALKKGEVITKEHIRRIRPGSGLPPKYYDELIGKVVTRDVGAGEPVTFEVIISS